MARLGYIYKAESDSAFYENRDWMEEYGCVRIMYEEPKHEKLRPEWKHLMEMLGHGDELVLARFCNAVRSTEELSTLLDFCRVMQVRVVSIGDKIDSAGKLFPNTSIGHVLSVIGTLPEESMAMRMQKEHLANIKRGALARKAKVTQKANRERTIVNMYHEGYSLDDIWAASGFSSKCSVYYVLNKHGVTLNRGKTSGPRKKKDD